MQSHNPMDLAGRCVLVTGASSGLGRASAQLLARLGARIVGVARNTERLRETFASLHGEGHVMRSFDLNETDAIPGLVSDLAREVSPFSGLVHCAGFPHAMPLRVVRTRDFESVYRINVVAAGMLLRGIAQRQVTAPQGCSCVLLGSVMSVTGAAGLAAYAAAKTGLLGLVRSAALELARQKIRVNAVLPGLVRTELFEQAQAAGGEEYVRSQESLHPLGLGQPDDVANAVAFLLADTARWITGSCLVVDGGYTAQ